MKRDKAKTYTLSVKDKSGRECNPHHPNYDEATKPRQAPDAKHYRAMTPATEEKIEDMQNEIAYLYRDLGMSNNDEIYWAKAQQEYDTKRETFVEYMEGFAPADRKAWDTPHVYDSTTDHVDPWVAAIQNAIIKNCTADSQGGTR